MERALKERIVGASVLVVFVVLVVPVFLDGPPEEDEVVSHQVSLPGQNPQTTQTVILDRDRDEPVPAAAATRPELRDRTPAPVRETPLEPAQASAGRSGDGGRVSAGGSADDAADDEPAPAASSGRGAEPPARLPPESNTLATANEASTSATGMWAVQLGSFSSRDNAERLAADLRRQGFAAFLSRLSTGSGELHRVRIGPQKDRDDAEAMAGRLSAAGHTGQVVPHP